MIEIYLFINPLDKHSLKSENKFLEIIKKENEKIHFRIIPVLNPRVIQNYLLDYHMPTADLGFRNELFTTIYSACLDFKAVQLQGKQIGRKFLFELQKKVGQEKHPYTKELVHEILMSLNVDMDLYTVDRQSSLIIDFFKIDQQVAHEMGINSFSDAVIFNYNCERDFGVLVSEDTPKEMIQDLFKTDYDCERLSFINDDDRLHLH